jgi:hypothetical protein
MTSLTKPVSRKTRRPFMHYGAPIVVELGPGDVLILRLLRHERRVAYDLHALYFSGVKRDVAAEKRSK